MKVSESRIVDGRAFGYSWIIGCSIWGTEIIPDNSRDVIAQVVEALLVLRTISEVRGVKAIVYTKLCERELKTVIP